MNRNNLLAAIRIQLYFVMWIVVAFVLVPEIFPLILMICVFGMVFCTAVNIGGLKLYYP